MQDLRATGKDALLLLLILILAGLSSLFLNSDILTGIIAVTGIVSLLGHRRRRRTNQNKKKEKKDQNSPDQQSDAGNQSQADSPDEDSDPDSANDTDDTSEPLDRTGLRRSNDEILEVTGDKLRGQVNIYDDGTIELHDGGLDLYRKLMLYVIAKRMAYEDRLIDTPAVTLEDINDHPGLDYNRIEILVFLHESRKWLVPLNDQDVSSGSIDYTELKDAEFTVKTRSISEIADWILEEDSPNPRDIVYSLRMANKLLNEADTRYNEIREQQHNQNSTLNKTDYDYISQKVEKACFYAADYPIIFERDNLWDRYTKYAEALLDYMDMGRPEKISHCLPRMQRYREQMEEEARECGHLL